MPNSTRSLEPPHFARFRCLGADYQKYRQCSDPEWRASFAQLITVNTASPTDHDYARIQLSTTTCPFLSEGLCSIHKKFGEECLPVTCASFPRVWNIVDRVVEKSLDLGCPEAARQTLLDPEPMAYAEAIPNGPDLSAARISTIDSSSALLPEQPYRHFAAVRTFVVWLLQYRAYPLWKRLVVLGLSVTGCRRSRPGPESLGYPT